MTTAPTVHLVAGSTGAGKTTFSIRLAEQERALRLSIDEWMTTLFGPDQPTPIEFSWMMDRINRCETLMWATALEAARRGIGCVIDCGLTRAAHRQKFGDLAREAGLPVVLHWLDVDVEERWRRVERRNTERGETFRLEVTRPMFDFIEQMWEPPTAEEMAALGGKRHGS
jgi:predicted kinase